MLTAPSMAHAQSPTAKPSEPPISEQQFIRTNEKLMSLFRAGNEAMIARRYDEAIKYYDDGIKYYGDGVPADPNLALLWVNKAASLIARGMTSYNAVFFSPDEQNKKARRESFRKDIREGATAATKGVELINAQPVPKEESILLTFEAFRLAALRTRAGAMWILAIKVDESYAANGLAAFQEYIAAEPEPSIKLQAQIAAAGMMLETNAFDKAAEEFQKALTIDPGNVSENLFSLSDTSAFVPVIIELQSPNFYLFNNHCFIVI